MNREPGIERLLNDARDVAIRAVDGLPATRANLDTMAVAARQAVLVQAECGLWKEWCVTEARDLAELRVKVNIFPLRTPPIEFDWDFKATPLRHLATISSPEIVDKRKR